jgi:hypothetical protein
MPFYNSICAPREFLARFRVEYFDHPIPCGFLQPASTRLRLPFLPHSSRSIPMSRSPRIIRGNIYLLSPVPKRCVQYVVTPVIDTLTV